MVLFFMLSCCIDFSSLSHLHLSDLKPKHTFLVLVEYLKAFVYKLQANCDIKVKVTDF